MTRYLLSGLVVIAALLVSSPVAAQFYADPEDTPAIFTSTTTTSTALLVGGIVMTVVMIQPEEEPEKLKAYLRDNRTALEQDLALGAGPVVEDLAASFAVARRDRDAFGRLLRAHREELLALSQPDRLDDDRARAFVATILAAMAQDETLYEYASRVDVRSSATGG